MTAITPHRPDVVRVPHRAAGARPHGHTPSVDPVRVLRRHALAIVISVIVGGMLGAGAYVGLLMIYPLYQGEVLFELQPGLKNPTELGTNEITRDDLIERLARTQTVLLTSREVLERAMENPDITRNTMWYEKYVGPDGIFDIQDAVDDLEEEISAPVLRGTNLFALRWSASNKRDVPVVLNSITTAYTNKRRELDEQAILNNNRVFRGRLEETEAALRDINTRIQQFILERGLTTTSDPRFGPVAQELQQTIEKISDAREELSFQNSLYSVVQMKLEGTMEPQFEDRQEAELNPRLILLNQRLDDKRRQQKELIQKYGPDHGQVVAIEKEVRAAEDQRDDALQEIIRQNLEATRRNAIDRIEALQVLLDDLEEEAEAKDKLLRELTARHSEYVAMETERDQLEEERQRNFQLLGELQLMRLRADANRVRVAQAAIPPRQPSFPRPEVMLPFGVLLVVGLTLAWIFFRELTDQRIKSTSDLEVLPGATVLGSIPDLEDDPTRSKSAELVVREHPNSVLAESYRQAVTAMCRSIELNGYQSVLFFSAMPGAGNTTSLTNVACVLAAMGKRVCVVDGDFRRPRLAEAFGVDEQADGMGDVLCQSASLDDVIQDADGISVISAGTPANRVVERLGNSSLESVLAEMRAKFDVVLFDTAPAVVAGDALAIARRVDAAVMVVRANREQRGLVRRLVGEFNDKTCPLIGLLLNRPLSSAGGYFKKNYAAMARYGLTKTG